MKKIGEILRSINPDLLILAAIGLLLLGGLLVNKILIRPISINQVARITLGSYSLNEAETKEFVKIYNSAWYKGASTNCGCDARYRFNIELRNGKRIKALEDGCDLDVIRYVDGEQKSRYCININDRMNDFVKAVQSKREK